jgi:hypothetical protein
VDALNGGWAPERRFGGGAIELFLALPFPLTIHQVGCHSAQRLLPDTWGQEVPGSNPGSPTDELYGFDGWLLLLVGARSVAGALPTRRFGPKSEGGDSSRSPPSAECPKCPSEKYEALDEQGTTSEELRDSRKCFPSPIQW